MAMAGAQITGHNEKAQVPGKHGGVATRVATIALAFGLPLAATIAGATPARSENVRLLVEKPIAVTDTMAVEGAKFQIWQPPVKPKDISLEQWAGQLFQEAKSKEERAFWNALRLYNHLNPLLAFLAANQEAAGELEKASQTLFSRAEALGRIASFSELFARVDTLGVLAFRAEQNSVTGDALRLLAKMHNGRASDLYGNGGLEGSKAEYTRAAFYYGGSGDYSLRAAEGNKLLLEKLRPDIDACNYSLSFGTEGLPVQNARSEVDPTKPMLETVRAAWGAKERMNGAYSAAAGAFSDQSVCFHLAGYSEDADRASKAADAAETSKRVAAGYSSLFRNMGWLGLSGPR